MTVKDVIKEYGLNTASGEGYTYFAEAQYKKIATDLLSEIGLDIKISDFSFLNYSIFENF